MAIGRPPKFETPEQLQEMLDKYFAEDCPTREIVITNQKSITVKVPTISGLALYLGFCDRYSFYEYEKKPLFTYTIKAARAKITLHHEEIVQGGQAAGAIFMLKNFGYSDKQEIDLNANITKMEKITKDGKALEFYGTNDPQAIGHTVEAPADS